MGLKVLLQGAKPCFSCSLRGQARPGASHGSAAAALGCHRRRGGQDVLLHLLTRVQLWSGLVKGGCWQQSPGSAGGDGPGTEVGDI